MANGYTGSDSASEAEMNHVADSLALHQLSQQINDNKSGECEECGEGIPARRLMAVPNAKFCVACQHEHDQLRVRNICRNVYVP